MNACSTSQRSLDARADMLLGSCLAGLAIEQSMLGATHACANPLTARFGTTHGIAIAVMLPHVVRWNSDAVGDCYEELLTMASGRVPDARRLPVAGKASEADRNAGARLADYLAFLARAGSLPSALRDLGVTRDDLPGLSKLAEPQWTGTFNPRPFNADAALALYQKAY